MRRLRRSLGAVLASLLVGCAAGSGVTVKTDHDPTISFSTFRTYGWLAERYTPGVASRSSDPFLESRLRSIPELIERELVAKGYQKDPSGRPDFRVAYRVATQRGRLDSFSDYGWYRQSGGREDLGTAYVGGYEEGSLTIDIIDGAGKRLLWRGSARAVVDDAMPAADRSRRLAAAVKKMLQDFPPR